MNKYFVDTDVIIDLLSARLPHFHFAAVLFSLAEMGKYQLYTSPTVFANAFYVLRKQLGNEKAKTALRKLRIILHVIDSTEKVIDQALNSDFADFEDAIQFYTALNNEIKCLITRNIKDFKASTIPIMTPEAFLSVNKLI